MSWWDALLVAFCWVGWALALAALWTLHRRLERMADAEHELRGAVTTVGLALEAEDSPLLELELARMTAALADLAEARGAPAAPPPDLEAGRLAQVLGNLIANAAEHGVGPVQVKTHDLGDGIRLELSNRERPERGRGAAGRSRGRGVAIAKRAARELGGRLTLERTDGSTKATLELPGSAARGAAGDAAAGEPAAGEGASRDGAARKRASDDAAARDERRRAA